MLQVNVSSRGLKQTVIAVDTVKRRLPLVGQLGSEDLALRIRDYARLNIRTRARYNPPSRLTPGPHPGQLENNIYVRIYRQGAQVISAAPHSKFVEEGTRPHFIPFGMGRIAGVNHPGARPMWFMRDAYNRAVDEMDAIFYKKLREQIAKRAKQII